MSRHSRGFTLMELLVVIAIIGILSGVVLASLNTARAKGRDARRIADIKQLQLALELYYDSNSQYPDSVSADKLSNGVLDALTPDFISKLPEDPTSTQFYWYISDDTTESSSYCLGATLEGTANADDTCTAPDFVIGDCVGGGTNDECTFKVGP